MLTLVFTGIGTLPVFASASVQVFCILTKANLLIYSITPSFTLPTRWFANVSLGHFHPIRSRNPRKETVGVREDPRVARAVADLVVKDVDGVAGF